MIILNIFHKLNEADTKIQAFKGLATRIENNNLVSY